jgi:hypothetical protein
MSRPGRRGKLDSVDRAPRLRDELVQGLVASVELREVPETAPAGDLGVGELRVALR